jgi:DNA polymerase-4
MPSVTAERLCPQAVWLPGRMDLYVEVSAEIGRILDTVSPVVEPLSIDEAFLDLSGIASGLSEGAGIARELKERIRGSQRLTASCGIAPNKFLAKIASDLEKPDGLVVLPLAAVEARLWPLPVGRLWGVGPKTEARLLEAGLRTIGDIAAAAEPTLAGRVGVELAAHLKALARGEDDRPVEPDRAAKSISEERTYGDDLRDPDAIDRALLERAEGVARELRHQGVVGRTVHVKVRAGDFTTWTRARTLPEPTDLAEEIVRVARALFADRISLGGQGVRLLGVGISGLGPQGSGQGSLFVDDAAEKARRLARAADAVRERFGDGAVQRARLLRRRGEEHDGDAEASSLPSVD